MREKFILTFRGMKLVKCYIVSVCSYICLKDSCEGSGLSPRKSSKALVFFFFLIQKCFCTCHGSIIEICILEAVASLDLWRNWPNIVYIVCLIHSTHPNFGVDSGEHGEHVRLWRRLVQRFGQRLHEPTSGFFELERLLSADDGRAEERVVASGKALGGSKVGGGVGERQQVRHDLTGVTQLQRWRENAC